MISLFLTGKCSQKHISPLKYKFIPNRRDTQILNCFFSFPLTFPPSSRCWPMVKHYGIPVFGCKVRLQVCQNTAQENHFSFFSQKKRTGFLPCAHENIVFQTFFDTVVNSQGNCFFTLFLTENMPFRTLVPPRR